MWRSFGTSADTAIVDLVQLDTQTRWQQRWHSHIRTRKMYPVTPFENHCIFVLLHAIVITSVVVQRSSSSLSSSLIRGRTRPFAQGRARQELARALAFEPHDLGRLREAKSAGVAAELSEEVGQNKHRLRLPPTLKSTQLIKTCSIPRLAPHMITTASVGACAMSW